VSGGFTLLELVLAMVIMCTLLAVAAPSLRGFFTSRRTDDTAARIASLTRLARSRAITEGRVYRLRFDDRLRTFYLTAQRDAGFERPVSSLGRPSAVPADVQLDLLVDGADPGRDYVEFYPDGRTEPASVRLTDIKGFVLEVACPAPTELFTVTRPETDR
jgi:type II secretion system protein H